MKVEGSRVLVTGAGRRLGQAIALGLAERGASIVVHYAGSEKGAEETAAKVRSLGGEAWTVQVDLATEEAGELVAHAITNGPGILDGIVNSAATFVDGSVEKMDATVWNRILDVNLRAPYLLTRELVPLLRMGFQHRGTPSAIVNMVDLSALHPWLGYAVHGVSKAGLLHLTRALARELAPDVRVNAVIPGAILPGSGTDLDAEEWQDWGRRLPLERTGDPDEVAAAVAFLLESDFITGVAVPVDGGENLLGVAARRESDRTDSDEED